MKRLRYRFVLTIGTSPWGRLYLTRDGLGLLSPDLPPNEEFAGTEQEARDEGIRRLERYKMLHPRLADDGTVTLEEVGKP